MTGPDRSWMVIVPVMGLWGGVVGGLWMLILLRELGW